MDSELTDETLMMRYRDDDEQAFASLYTRHKGGLYRYMLRQCGNATTAEELFHDVWMKLINARKRYTASAKFTTYLYHMAHNRLIDYYRKHRSGVPVSFEDNDCPSLDDIADPVSIDPGIKEDLRRQIVYLLALIDALPEAQREAYLLHEEGGLNIDEIAEVTRVSKETAKSRLRYAISKIRKQLGESL